MVIDAKKTTYTLKTPHVVFLSFFFGPNEHFFALATLTFGLDLQTWPRCPSTGPSCQNSNLNVYPFGQESGNRHTERQTERHMMTKLLHPICARRVKTSKDLKSSLWWKSWNWKCHRWHYLLPYAVFQRGLSFYQKVFGNLCTRM